MARGRGRPDVEWRAIFVTENRFISPFLPRNILLKPKAEVFLYYC